MTSVEAIVEKLKSKARPDQLEGMARYGMVIKNRLGVSVPDMRKLAKEIGKDHTLAVELWQTGIAEAMMVAGMIDLPESVTEEQMEEWVKDFNSWDVCDQVCMNLFDKTPLAWKKVLDWAEREEELVRRAAFALIACLAWHDKTALDEKFIELIPIIQKTSTDPRNYVKKAVSWALRHIGKRNGNLNKLAIEAAREIQKIDSKTARWIASDVTRDITRESIQNKLK